jgi:hypothetical protein
MFDTPLQRRVAAFTVIGVVVAVSGVLVALLAWLMPDPFGRSSPVPPREPPRIGEVAARPPPVWQPPADPQFDAPESFRPRTVAWMCKDNSPINLSHAVWGTYPPGIAAIEYVDPKTGLREKASWPRLESAYVWIEIMVNNGTFCRYQGRYMPKAMFGRGG